MLHLPVLDAQSRTAFQVRNRDGRLETRTVIPVIAFGSYDAPEIARVTNKKDFYMASPMFCHLYDPTTLPLTSVTDECWTSVSVLGDQIH